MKRPEGMSFEKFRALRWLRKEEAKRKLAGRYVTGDRAGASAFQTGGSPYARRRP